MAAPLSTPDLDYAIKLYLTGEAIEKVTTDSGVSLKRLHAERKARGIPSRYFRDVPEDDIIKAYQAGASEYGLSRQYGVSRGLITKRLLRAGVKRRSNSEAGLVRVAQMTPDERKAQASAAHKATRMRSLAEIEKYRRALTIEHQGRAGSVGEHALRGMLVERGEVPAVERAVGPYNVDLTMLPVAVEVLGGGFHGVKARHAERTPYILDAGWHLVMVWNYEGVSALGSGAADYLVAFVQQVRRNPPATCQYRVITGQGQVLAASGREDNEFPLVPPPRGRIHAGA